MQTFYHSVNTKMAKASIQGESGNLQVSGTYQAEVGQLQ